MSEAGYIERDLKQSILLPEAGHYAVKAFQAMNERLNLPVIVEEMSLDAAIDLLHKGEVAAVLAGAENTTGDVAKAGILKFNPRRNEEGVEDLRGERSLVSSFIAFERGGDEPFIMGDCAIVPSPEEHELLQIAEHTVSNAVKIGLDPHVAFLSYSTEGSGHGDPARKIHEVARRFRELYPAVPTLGEIQWDAANEEEIYRMKTNKNWPADRIPNVYIAPNLDTGNSIYKVLQDRRRGGGWTAVGPLLQGFEGGYQLHDLSRGVTPEALAVICKYIARLAGLVEPPESETQTTQA